MSSRRPLPAETAATATVRVQREAFDVAAEGAALTGRRVDIGALVTFVGLCRDEAGALAALELEHYPGMAEEEMARVVGQAQARWPLLGVTVIHRFGRIAPGEPIVLVAIAAAHRGEAFDAAEMLMDYLKTRAPFWKRVIRSDGAAGDWVESKAGDDESAARWSAAD